MFQTITVNFLFHSLHLSFTKEQAPHECPKAIERPEPDMNPRIERSPFSSEKSSPSAIFVYTKTGNGSAETKQKTSFSFVSALTFSYLCSTNHKLRTVMETLEKIFAAKLLKVKAIKLQPTNPFTWASGWKSPFYCDNRKTLSYPELRNFVKIEIGRLIAERFPEADAIAGVATGAIPQGALVADLLNLPFVYVRSKPKDHGLENLIEGELRPGMKVVVVEDLISTGGSSLKAVEAIRNNGCEVSGMVAAYTYGFDVAAQAFKAANVKLITLTNYEAVVAEAVRIGYIDPSDVEVLNEWRKDPAHWNG